LESDASAGIRNRGDSAIAPSVLALSSSASPGSTIGTMCLPFCLAADSSVLHAADLRYAMSRKITTSPDCSTPSRIACCEFPFIRSRSNQHIIPGISSVAVEFSNYIYA
jgi:hypothetical protein